jgi:hypothetical protein
MGADTIARRACRNSGGDGVALLLSLFGPPQVNPPQSIAWVVAPLLVGITTFGLVFLCCLIFNLIAKVTGGLSYLGKDEQA